MLSNLVIGLDKDNKKYFFLYFFLQNFTAKNNPL